MKKWMLLFLVLSLLMPCALANAEAAAQIEPTPTATPAWVEQIEQRDREIDVQDIDLFQKILTDLSQYEGMGEKEAAALVAPNYGTTGEEITAFMDWVEKTEEDKGEEIEGDMVWVPTNGGTKHHKSETCSGMDNPILVSKEEALKMDFDACKKCWK